MGRTLIVVALALLGGALVVIGLVTGSASFGIEGAYFTRAAGTPAYSGIFTSWGTGAELGSPHDGNVWIGAGAWLLVLAAAGISVRARGVVSSVLSLLAVGTLLLLAGIALGPPGITGISPRGDGYDTNAALFNPQDGNVWIGAGIVCAVAGLVLWIVRSVAASRTGAQRV